MFLFIFNSLFLSSCFKLAPVKLPQLAKDVPLYYQARTEKIPLNDSECLLGGVKTITWVDHKNADGVYTEGEDSDYKEDVICFYATTTTATVIVSS